MTLADRLARRPRRPRPWLKFNRAQYEHMFAGLREALTHEQGKTRAHADWVSSWLQQRADAHDKDARHHGTHETRRLAHRMTADDLRELMHDLENGPRP